MPLIPDDPESIARHAAYLSFLLAAVFFTVLLMTRKRWDGKHRYGWFAVFVLLLIDLAVVAAIGWWEPALLLFVVLAIQGMVGGTFYYRRQSKLKMESEIQREHHFRE